MPIISRFFMLCFFIVSSIAIGQTTTQEDLGSITAAQAASGLGWEVNTANEQEFIAAAQAGASHVRFDSCAWSTIEGQSAPPNNVSTGYSLSPVCVQALNFTKKYGLHPTVIAGYGAPFHQILNLTLSSASAIGSTTLSVELASGIGGKTLQSIEYPYDYITDTAGDRLSAKYSYDGTLIAGIAITGTNTATITLASALTIPLPSGAGLQVNEILYPSPATGNPADPSIVAFTRYAEYLANQLKAYGLTGEVELWNEPPWKEDCWDNRVDCFDTDPKIANELKGNTPNYGFAAVMQTTPPVSGVTYIWAGTNKSGSADLLGSRLLQYTGATFLEPQPDVTIESFHPYGSNPEDGMWNEPCLLADLAHAQTCNTIPANNGNIVNAAAATLKAQEINPAYGISHNITETGASTLYMPADHMARFMTRQYLGYMADGMSSIEFYRLYDNSVPGQDGFSFVTLTNNNTSYTPLPAYNAMSGLMADLSLIAGAPVASYSDSTLPSVTSYEGTYNLDHLSLVGSRTGDTANSVMYVLWQRSYSSTACQNYVAVPCWGNLDQPAAASTVVTIPSGMKIMQAVNLDTRAAVQYNQTGSTVELSVSDDPIELMLLPASDSTSSFKPHLVFDAIGTQTQGNSVSIGAVSNSPGAITYSVVSGPATIVGNTVSLPTAGTVILKASQAASGIYSSATVTTSFTVTAQTTTLTFIPITPKTFGDSLVVTAQSNSPAAITYSVVSGPASVSGNIATMTGAGTVVLGAAQAASGVYGPATATVSFSVAAKAPGLTFTAVSPKVYGAAFSVSAASPSSGAITYSVVSGPATISGAAVTLTGVGEVVLKASQAASGGYTAASATTQFYVSAQTPALVFASIPTTPFNTAVTVNASSASSGTVIYSVVSGPARISGSTVTTLSTAGTVVIKAYQVVSGGYASATATVSFAVTATVTPTLSFASISTKTVGSVFQVSATSASPGAITYAIGSGPATIAGSTVTVTGSGTIVIHAIQAASGGYKSATATTSFTVAAAGLAFATIPPENIGDVFTVSATSSSHGVITYSVVSGPATIAGSTVTVTAIGTVVLEASQAAAGGYPAATATTSFSVAGQIPALAFVPITPKTFGDKLGVLAQSASPGAITYSVEKGPAFISGQTVTMNGSGTVVLKATQAPSGTYAAATATISFPVAPDPLPLTFVNITPKTDGNVLVVRATTDSPGAVTYFVASGPASMSGNTVTMTGVGTVTLKANQAASGVWPAASTTISFPVAAD